MKRRTFLAYGLAAGLAAARGFAETPPANAAQNPARPNAFSRLKKKLRDGQSATLLIISDSTGYPIQAGTRRFIRWLAAQFPAHRVAELLWAEWTSHGATGPKLYGDPILIAEGTTPATLTVLNAALPGAYAQAMIDGLRWAPMLAPLNTQPPDLILWNHGA